MKIIFGGLLLLLGVYLLIKNMIFLGVAIILIGSACFVISKPTVTKKATSSPKAKVTSILLSGDSSSNCNDGSGGGDGGC